MRTGNVDEEWARSHHEIWYNEVVNGPLPDDRFPHGAAPHHPRA
ncbi:hypothetical protein ACNSPR_30475 [Klebsiella pneumoniae]